MDPLLFLTNLFIHHTANYNRLHRPQRRGCLSVYQGRASALQSMNSISPIHWDRISSVLQITNLFDCHYNNHGQPHHHHQKPTTRTSTNFQHYHCIVLIELSSVIEIKPIHPLPPSWIIDLMRVV
ncbi:hypothetical protein OIU74_013328 [Salix koriyanagi]|uniref:Uncharacterized protein n=1 Tax=Salix koriyanagi TaxID=2511006 RepID=A0A9Q0Q8T2_9ROSI|nr:hypothetical protein OIU74_013328 [Salix koriyanagi]